MTGEWRETALHEEHVRLGGKMVPFAGYSLPVQYSAGIHAEHHAVREAVGLFDVSHMGEIEIRGREALDWVQWMTVNDASSLAVGRAQYSLLCNERGGVVDDLLVCRLDESRYLLVVNAANRDTDVEWIRSSAGRFDAELEDRSETTALVAVQGPGARETVGRVADRDLDALRPFGLTEAELAGRTALVSRTGYTGEDGYEIYMDPESAVDVWRALLDAGADLGILPCGLGARDTLRIEAGLPLHGAELDPTHTPLEAGLGWVVKLTKGDFSGRVALQRQREEGVERRRVGIRLQEKGFPRTGYPVVSDGAEVGAVTSGTMSPTLGLGIAMAYVPVDLAGDGTPLRVRVRGKDLRGIVVSLPFYTGGAARR